MLTGQVRLSVGAHPLGDDHLLNKEVETKKDEEDGSSKKEEKEEEEEEEEKVVDKAMLEMCEQLEPLMPQYIVFERTCRSMAYLTLQFTPSLE